MALRNCFTSRSPKIDRCEVPKLREHAACCLYLLVRYYYSKSDAWGESWECSFGTSVRSENEFECPRKAAAAFCTLCSNPSAVLIWGGVGGSSMFVCDGTFGGGMVL